MITLTADAAYGHSGQYVARITGRHSKFTFEREFIGRKGGKRNETTSADTDEPGLYEIRDIDRKGNRIDRYRVILADGTGELECFKCSKDDAMKIGKAFDEGRSIEQIVVTKDDTYEILTAKAAETRQAAQTVDTALDQCWAIIQALPVKQGKAVVAELKKRLSPPPVVTAEQPAEITEPAEALS